jgi:hypothetical protein
MNCIPRDVPNYGANSLISLISGADQPEQDENRSILAKSGPGIRFNEHMEGDGETVFRHACNRIRIITFALAARLPVK